MSERPTVLLLPGNMCDGRMWSAVADGLDGFEVQTPVPAGDDIHAMARDCLARFAGPVLPIGFSMGGIVALAMADLAPDRIAGIGLLDTNPGSDMPERAAERPRQQRDVLANGVEQVVAEELKPNYLAAANRGDRALLALLHDMAVDLGPDIFVRQSEALRTRPDQWPVVDRLHVRAFIACGAEDALCPPDLHRRIAARTASHTFHVIEGAGHMLPLEQPGRLRTLLAGWLHRVQEVQPCPNPS